MKYDTPFFSIIIPVYNAYDTLRQCIDSVLGQSFKSFEILLVDDGSTDGSSSICDEYASLNSSVHVIHKRNSGGLESRIIGIEKAEGKYITGVDADDYYAGGYLETIYSFLKDGQYDVGIWSLTQFGDHEEVSKISEEHIGERSRDELLYWILESTAHGFVYKAFKKDIIKSVDYSGAPDVRLSNDYCLTIPVLFHVNKGIVLDYYGYMYRIHNSGITKSVDFSKIMDLCKVSEYGLKLIDDNELNSYEMKACEHIGFMRVFYWRMIYALQNRILTEKQIKTILESKAYIEAEDAERIDIFGEKTYNRMKLLRENRIDDLIKNLRSN